MTKTKNNIGFTVGTHGFHIGFTNGYTVSVQFGPGNYCEPPGGRWGAFDGPLNDLKTNGTYFGGPTAEVAVFAPDGEFLRRIQPHDDVVGWCEPEKVAEFIATVSRLPNEEGLSTEGVAALREAARNNVRRALGEALDADEDEPTDD